MASEELKAKADILVGNGKNISGPVILGEIMRNPLVEGFNVIMKPYVINYLSPYYSSPVRSD